MALIGGLLALGFGIGAVMAAFAPFAIVLLIFLTPFLLVVWILQKAHVVRTRAGATLTLALLLLFAAGTVRYGFGDRIGNWVEMHRDMVDQCNDGRHHEFDMGWFHVSCGPQQRKPDLIDT